MPDSRVSDEHRTAIEGWKSRKEQLHRQQELVHRITNEAEKVDLLLISKKKVQ